MWNRAYRADTEAKKPSGINPGRLFLGQKVHTRLIDEPKKNPVDDDQELLANALECRRMADNTSHPPDKVSWLRLASSRTRKLSETRERPETEKQG